MTPTTETATCPRCGTERLPDAAFCEECAYDFQGSEGEPAHHTIRAAATPDTTPAGDESPLDTGWTGRPTAPPAGRSVADRNLAPPATEPEGSAQP